LQWRELLVNDMPLYRQMPDGIVELLERHHTHGRAPGYWPVTVEAVVNRSAMERKPDMPCLEVTSRWM
jgi:hypothetical protein